MKNILTFWFAILSCCFAGCSASHRDKLLLDTKEHKLEILEYQVGNPAKEFVVEVGSKEYECFKRWYESLDCSKLERSIVTFAPGTLIRCDSFQINIHPAHLVLNISDEPGHWNQYVMTMSDSDQLAVKQLKEELGLH